MKIVDRYILSEFIRGFLISLVGLLVIYIIVDMFEHISKFVDNEVPVLGIIQYYVYQIPWIIGTTLSPIACLLGCFISVGNLSMHFELAAFRFSGMSSYRLCLSLLGVGVVLSTLILGMNETLSPITNQKEIDLERSKIQKHSNPYVVPSKGIYYSGEDNKFYHIKFIDPRKGIVTGLTIYEFMPDYSVKSRIDAPRAVWQKNKWHLFDGSIKLFKPNSFEQIDFDSLILNLSETPLDFVKESKPTMAMGFPEFKRYISKMQRSGEDVTKQMVDLYTRLSFPFMNLIVILLGFPLASKVRNIGFIIGFAIALFVSFMYWGLMQLAKALGQANRLSPIIASVLPNIVFLVAATVLIWKFRK